MANKCPKCGSSDIIQDEADIGVGIQYGPLFCNECAYDESIALDKFLPPEGTHHIEGEDLI
jgi:predicted nucleic-acid-binding Zn-ribbon protein